MVVFFSYAQTKMTSPYTTKLEKPFYITAMNDYVYTHIFHQRETCIGARFSPISPEYYFFHFFDYSRNLKFFEGTLLKHPGQDGCFHMITQDRTHNNLTLCFREHDDDYHYIYVTDVLNITGFGLVDSIINTTSKQTMYEIMQTHNQQPCIIPTSHCIHD